MKIPSLTILRNLAALAMALAIAGCASPGYQKGEQTAANIQEAADHIGALPAKIDDTLSSLNALVTTPQPDLRPQFKAFSAQLAGLVSAGKDIAAARGSIGTKGKEFFAKWDEQLATIKNEDIKARSESRKAEVAQQLQSIKRSYAEAEMSFKPFMADLQDVQKFLAMDLTGGGVAAIKNTATKAQLAATPLKTSLAKLAADFKSLGLAMSAVTPAPAK